MNMIMDSGHSHSPAIQRASPLQECPQAKELQISTTPPTPPNDDSYHGNLNNQLSPRAATTTTTTTKATLKRSFDVAFLMMPDERLKNNRSEKQKSQIQLYPHSNNKQPEISVKQDLRRYPQITVKAPRIYDDPTVLISPSEWESSSPLRSAFTKVPSRLESPGQPAPSLSPDQLSCSSMSPPVATTPPRSASGSSSDIISIDSLPSSPTSISPNIVYQNFRPEYPPNGAFHSVQNLQTQRLKQQFIYRPGLSQDQTVGPPAPPPPPQIPNEFLPVYPGFPFPPGAGPVPHPFANISHHELPRIVQNPAAAAILSTLIPPTLASTFTLTAQNVCAKCNISFRMTSDLVYHMRSHHKSEVATDPNRRKREEKLKCPVCQESFRERHHLTRHMTAHQDKESDQTTTTTTNSLNANHVGSNPSHTRSSGQRSSAYAK